MSVEQLIALTILRKDVEAGNINRAYGVLEDLSASTAHALRFRRSLVFMFEGYEAEPRELYEVPEIRAYFNDLAVAWPYWAWFVDCRAQLPFLPIVISLLTPGQAVIENGRPVWRTSQRSLRLAANDLLDATDELASTLALPYWMVDETKARFKALVEQSFNISLGA